MGDEEDEGGGGGLMLLPGNWGLRSVKIQSSLSWFTTISLKDETMVCPQNLGISDIKFITYTHTLYFSVL